MAGAGTTRIIPGCTNLLLSLWVKKPNKQGCSWGQGEMDYREGGGNIMQAKCTVQIR